MSLHKQLLILGIALFFAAVLLFVLRRRHLRPEYSLAWLVMIALIGFLGVCPKAIGILVRCTDMTYQSSVILLVFLFIAGMFLHVSLIACRHGRRIVRLTQEVALLRMELEESRDAQAARQA